MTKKELLEVLEEYEDNETIDFDELDFVHHFRTLEQIPPTYAEIEYNDFESAEAVMGSRFDDINFLRYLER